MFAVGLAGLGSAASSMASTPKPKLPQPENPKESEAELLAGRRQRKNRAVSLTSNIKNPGLGAGLTAPASLARPTLG